MVQDQPAEGRGQEQQIPEELPILPSRDSVLFPYLMLPLTVGREKSVRLIDEAATGRRIIGLFAQRQPEEEEVSPEGLHSIGTAAGIIRLLRAPDGSLQVLLQGLSRLRLLEVTQTEPYLVGRVEVLREHEEVTAEIEAMRRNLTGLFQRAVSLAPNLPDELATAAVNIPQPGRLADFVASALNLSLAERQDVLETLDVNSRLRKVLAFINRELEVLELGSRIQAQIRSQMEKTQRDYYLREQLKAIQKELGETSEQEAEIDELRNRVHDAQLPPESEKEAERELDRLSRMPPAAPEYGIIRTYLDWLTSLPWNKSTVDDLDIGRARGVLDEDHYDLEKIKDRILEYLSVRKLKQDTRGPILCFVGPPGVGKTSLGQSIARALGRKFVRMSLGGVRDEAEIRGHRRTYIGAMPGRIIQGLRRAESNNPVLMLDEVDKLSVGYQGDPAAALLEVLDPAQNSTFVDNYLGVPFDLSRVLFITTANVLHTIPPALLDRMEVLSLSGYTEAEKLQIARRYLLPRQLRENGLSAEQLEVTDEALRAIIQGYTREAGVRNLEREIGTICRKVAKGFAEGRQERVVVDAAQVADYLGPRRFRSETAEREDEVGVTAGLSVTPVGGELLFVECSVVPGKGNLTLTGQLGDVMRESAQAALTYARSRARALGLPENFYEHYDVHIHVPAGAIPKDGPSAGVTMATSLISALTRQPVRRDVAMTGEVTLRGRVLPIGGLKEKVLAAHRAGIKTFILPKKNEKDMADIPPNVKRELEFVFVEHMDEVLRRALLDGEQSQQPHLSESQSRASQSNGPETTVEQVTISTE